MTATKEEIKVIKLVSAMGGFDSISDYVRSVVTADIVAKKKAHKNPWVFSVTLADWELLTAELKEQYLNQIGPVEVDDMTRLMEKSNAVRSPMLMKDPEVRYNGNDIEL